MKRLLSVAAFAALALACNKPTPPSSPPTPTTTAPAGAGPLTGTVLETIDAANYTYLRLKTASGEEWAAVPQADVKKGATVTVDQQMVQEHFQSKTLNRTFDRIVFGTLDGTPGGGSESGASIGSTGSEVVTGTVVEAIDAASYTYLRLRTSTGEVWAAVPETHVSKGATVSVAQQMVQENFQSKTLNRTFDRIIFGTLETGAQAGGAPANPAPAIAIPPHPKSTTDARASEHMRGGEANVDAKVAKASGADAKTVAEIWSQRKALENKQVSVRGKVVKFLPQILGKNWVHLRDGSGSAQSGDDELTVTTNDTAAVGDEVTAHGTVHIDKDFGAGYRYGAMLEDASLSK
jgi:hypothetical protein